MKLLVPPPVQGIVIAAAMWGVNALAADWALSFPGQKTTALVLIAFGVIVEVIAVAAFVRAKTTVNPMAPHKAQKLVVSGLYRISRNPMYLGLLSFLSGWALWLGNPLNVGLLAIWVAYITVFQIKPEEEALRDKFGQEYDDYCARVRRWIQDLVVLAEMEACVEPKCAVTPRLMLGRYRIQPFPAHPGLDPGSPSTGGSQDQKTRRPWQGSQSVRARHAGRDPGSSPG